MFTFVNEQICEIAIKYYVLCWIGAGILYFKSKDEGKRIFRILPHINKEWSDYKVCDFIDILLVTASGAFIATIFTHPTTAPQALAAGLGWTSILSSQIKA